MCVVGIIGRVGPGFGGGRDKVHKDVRGRDATRKENAARQLVSQKKKTVKRRCFPGISSLIFFSPS